VGHEISDKKAIDIFSNEGGLPMIVQVAPVTSNCSIRYEEKRHVCFGISPFNSYFSEQRIQDLATWGFKHFEQVDFFMPDGPSAFTLEALGYDSEKAEWKARRQGRYLKNKIVRALANLGVEQDVAEKSILNWTRLRENERYAALHKEVLDHYNSDNFFKEACLEASRWVLEKMVDDPNLMTREMLTSAVRYLLAEIPLFVDCASIVDSPSSVFCYHQCPDFIAKLIEGFYPIRASSNQGFIVFKFNDIDQSDAVA
jgi:cyclo(L-tyrosyl-L-tyrosyl) synthase